MKDDSQEEFYVEKILDKKVIDNITYYLLKWYDYDVSESTWEPKQGLGKIRNLIRNYEKKIKTDKVHNEKLVKTRRRINISHKKCKKPFKHVKVKVFEANNMDFPESILGLKTKNNNKRRYLVKWQVRENGIMPETCYVDADYLKENFPNLLINFLESKIVVSHERFEE